MKSLADLFSQRRYVIPQYQREYAWEIRHCQDLIEDIELLPDELETHYLGPIMLARSNEKPLFDELAIKHETYEIVDGQQRLTTLILFLLAIQSRIKIYLPAIGESIRKTYGRKRVLDQNGSGIDNCYIFPLTLNSFCQNYYASNIINPIFSDGDQVGQPLRTSHKRLRDALEYFTEYLDKTKDRTGTIEEFKIWLIGLYDIITNKLKFTEENVEGMLEAGVIFETMNNRGKPISEMDKIKNSLLYLSSKTLPGDNRLPKLVENCWEHVLNTLMTAGFNDTRHEDQLLRANWIYSQNENSKEWRGIDSFKSRFNLGELRA